MSMNNITPFPFSNALPLQEGSSLIKADAWRKAFDKEQNEILKDIRSVKLGDEHETSNGDSDLKFLTSSQSAYQETEISQPANNKALLPQETTLQQPASGTTLNNDAHLNQSGSPYPLSGFLSQRDGLNTPLLGAMPYSGFMNGEVASAIEVFESHFKNKWPLKNVHMMHTDKGINVWIRDVNLSDSADIQVLIDRIKLALKNDNQTLAGLVLNGKIII